VFRTRPTFSAETTASPEAIPQPPLLRKPSLAQRQRNPRLVSEAFETLPSRPQGKERCAVVPSIWIGPNPAETVGNPVDITSSLVAAVAQRSQEGFQRRHRHSLSDTDDIGKPSNKMNSL